MTTQTMQTINTKVGADAPTISTGFQDPAIVSYSNWHMDHLRLMGTVQVCQACGHKRKGGVASETYVICTSMQQPNASISIKLSEVLKRYAYWTKEKETEVFLPELPCKVQWVEVPIDNCPNCFRGTRAAGKRALPAMLPAAIPQILNGYTGNLVEPSLEERHGRHKHRGKSGRPQVAPKKPVSLQELKLW